MPLFSSEFKRLICLAAPAVDHPPGKVPCLTGGISLRLGTGWYGVG
jgi:hypothetical protein